MRLLPISLLSALFATVVLADSPEHALTGVATPGEPADPADDSDLPDPTIFNSIEVPPLPDIEGEKFNTTIRDGYWFVKHHS